MIKKKGNTYKYLFWSTEENWRSILIEFRFLILVSWIEFSEKFSENLKVTRDRLDSGRKILDRFHANQKTVSSKFCLADHAYHGKISKKLSLVRGDNEGRRGRNGIT